MAQSDVIATVSILSQGVADLVSANNFYVEIVQELGRAPWLTNFTQLSVFTQGQLDFSLPAQAVNLKGVIYDNRWIHQSTLRELEPLNRTWRRTSSNLGPVAYVLDDSSHLDFSVYPTPGLPGTPIATPPKYDSTFAGGNLTVIYTEYRSTIPRWMEEAIAFGVLAREYARNSDHMDTDGAAIAQQVSTLLLMMVS